jgi:uncharacterized ParB-like nuclease family protein
VESGGTSQKTGVRSPKRSLHHTAVAVRSFNDLDVLANVRGQSRGVAYHNANRLSAVENAAKDLLADITCWCCNDDQWRFLQ